LKFETEKVLVKIEKKYGIVFVMQHFIAKDLYFTLTETGITHGGIWYPTFNL